MKPNKILTILLLTLGCMACSNSGTSNPQQSDQSKAEKQIVFKLDRIEKAFDKGDFSTACGLQLKLSQDLLNFDKVSPELLKSLREFQLKCGSRSFSIDF